MHGSTHYQWAGPATFMTNGPERQGKHAGAVNSYCINILGNWNACGNCHIGLGAEPELQATQAQLENIDCLICHQERYRRKKVDGVFTPDTENMTITMDEAARTVHLPTRANCLPCHAKAGGGDAVKRGDLALAHIATNDSNYDIHMATTGQNLVCQDCHNFEDHRVIGKGSDLRPSDRSEILSCASCHQDMVNSHPGASEIRRHTDRVACQACHIPIFAKNAADTPATEATETHRTWVTSHSTAPPFHPASEMANDLTPVYRFWNRYSDNYLLNDVAEVNLWTRLYPTSLPEGSAADPNAMLYPFKYKTARQPMRTESKQLIALDTSVYFATGDADAATKQGLVNMGFEATDKYRWIETETYQLLNHEVAPAGQALGCSDCHGDGARINLPDDFGYQLKAPESSLCIECHSRKEDKSWTKIHDIHVRDKEYGCSTCHVITPPSPRSLFEDRSGFMFK